MENLTNNETKDKPKRQSQGARKHIRRLKQAKRKGIILVVPPKKKKVEQV